MNMFLLVIGLALLALKVLEIGPVATWSWYVIAAPFVLTVAWWAWADGTGYTKRKAMDRENRRRDARIDDLQLIVKMDAPVSAQHGHGA